MTRWEIAVQILSGMAAGHMGLVLNEKHIERAVEYADKLIEILNRGKKPIPVPKEGRPSP